MTQTTATREIPLEIAHNVRHLGGYPARNGSRTSDSTIRSAGLHRLTPGGLATLADAGVKVIVDLRSAAERQRDVTPAVGPFGMQRIDAPVFEEDASPAGLGKAFQGFAPVYRSMLETGQPAYRALFETIAATDGRVLFHCAAGKDRTGVASALLLELAGVDDNLIAEDFALSAMLLAPVFDDWLPRMRERGIDESRARGLLAAEPADINATLAYVRDRYGDAEGYMTDIGMAPSAIAELRQKLIA